MLHDGSLPSQRAPTRPSLEVADIFRDHGPAYRQRHDLSPEQHKVMSDIEACRTAALGGHVEVCDSCGHIEPSYNSCRNRHCPKCQGLAAARWTDQRLDRLLPTHYFHLVFTLPQQLRALTMDNRRVIFALLFEAVSSTLLALGRDPQWLGGMLGLTCVLHTWTRQMHFHPHIHCIVTGGALNDDCSQWHSAKDDFLFPVHVLSRLFRGKFLAGLRARYDRGELTFGPQCAELHDPAAFSRLLEHLRSIEWVVYAKRPFGGPGQVVRYLGRYTHRVAISNARLLEYTDGQVTFTTKDGGKETVSAETFISRFLRHVLPKGFVKIRHYGLMSASHATTTLKQARALLEADGHDNVFTPVEADPWEQMSWKDLLYQLTGQDLSTCPRCGRGRMVPMPLGAVAQPEPQQCMGTDTS